MMPYSTFKEILPTQRSSKMKYHSRTIGPSKQSIAFQIKFQVIINLAQQCGSPVGAMNPCLVFSFRKCFQTKCLTNSTYSSTDIMRMCRISAPLVQTCPRGYNSKVNGRSDQCENFTCNLIKMGTTVVELVEVVRNQKHGEHTPLHSIAWTCVLRTKMTNSRSSKKTKLLNATISLNQ